MGFLTGFVGVEYIQPQPDARQLEIAFVIPLRPAQRFLFVFWYGEEMRTVRRPRLLTFGFALLATAIATLLTLATPLKTGGYFILFGVAVLLSARYGGMGPVFLPFCSPVWLSSIFSFRPSTFWAWKPRMILSVWGYLS